MNVTTVGKVKIKLSDFFDPGFDVYDDIVTNNAALIKLLFIVYLQEKNSDLEYENLVYLVTRGAKEEYDDSEVRRL